MKRLSFALLVLVNFYFAMARTSTVSNIVALQSAVNASYAGDTILLADGTYQNNSIRIATSNITVMAATPGGVYLNGTNEIVITGNYVTFGGFQFTAGSIQGIVISVEGNNDVLTHLNFNGYSAQKYITLKGQYDQVTYCNFENKPTSAPIGNLIHIATRADETPTYALIRYCSFQHIPGAGGDNGNECIRITNGTPSTYKARAVIEHCFFSNTGAGDSEVISVKSEENVIRYNTMVNNLDGNFCFRNGNNNSAYGNFFINSGGIRIKQANDIYCYNNYFENCGNGTVTAPVKYVFVTGSLVNLNFIHNTFVGGSPIVLDSSSASNTWANNIFKNTSGNLFTGSVAGITFVGNLYEGTLGVPISTGMQNTNPQLILNANSYYGLSATSPAINNSSAAYPTLLNIPDIDDDPTILFDIEGQLRPTSRDIKDIGCDEFSNDMSTKHPLVLCDVGPSYLCPNSSSSKVLKTDDDLIIVYPNPSNGIFTVKTSLTISELTIINTLGETRYSVSNINQKHPLEINLTTESKGVYSIQLRDEHKHLFTKKIILK